MYASRWPGSLPRNHLPGTQLQAARVSTEARRLAHLADSLLGPAPVAQTRDTVKALAAFNEGADALDRLSEADSLQALEALEEAADKFEQALDADAFDDEASRWLAHVYEILAERFRREMQFRISFVFFIAWLPAIRTDMTTSRFWRRRRNSSKQKRPG